ncbi:MAG: DUF4102 domain-containing protein [Betaproteobacteria bacterium]|nr:DUF4102 domain-containing protein [Betaproteobacteria bacterium]
MTRKLNKLTAVAVKQAKNPGRLSDGGNLYLSISNTGVKSWVFMYSIGGNRETRGRQRELGLGPLHTVSLAEAREKATALRKIILDGGDPMEVRQSARLAASRAVTFAEAAKEYIATHRASWKNPKHADQWKNTLETYAYPVFGKYPVSQVDTELVLKALEPIWATKTETARRVLNRIGKILDYAKVQKYRTGENPATWRGHLEHSLPNPTKLMKVEHHPALPYKDMGAFMRDLRQRPGLAGVMLEVTILAAVRSNESRFATWGEIDLRCGLWTIPGERMKTGEDHVVPLTPRLLEIFTQLRTAAPDAKDSDFVFPGLKKGKPFSDSAMLAMLERMGRSDITTHGFRSTFRTWASDCTAFPAEVCEKALAHKVGNKVQEAYDRAAMLERRRQLMTAWENFCNTVIEETGNVIPMKGTTAA